MKFNNRNVFISPLAVIGSNVKIGDNTVIYDHVEIGNDSIICNDCVIGEPLHNYYSSDNYENPKTVIGAYSLVRSHTIIYADVIIGPHFQTGHRVTIREKSIFGKNCLIGTLGDVQGHVTIGDYCRTQSLVYIAQKSVIGNFVFIYPHAVFTNDWQPPSEAVNGPSIGDFSQIGACAVLFPGIKVGSNCLLGANSVINKDVQDYACVAGNPAKFIRDVREILSKENPGKHHYPWMYHFKRGMPWEEMGYEEWKIQNE